MMPDILQEVRDGSTNLTADETKGPFDVGPTPPGGLSLEVHLPAFVATTTLDVSVTADAVEGGSYSTTVAALPQISDDDGPANDGIGSYVLRFNTHLRFVKVVLNGTGATANFGAAKAYITNDAHRNVLSRGQLTAVEP